jgi:hypothetical protein
MNVKLTKAQQKIYDRLLAGEKVCNIHTHRQSGGEFVWVKKDGERPDYERTVWEHEPVGYRCFWNMMRRLHNDQGPKCIDVTCYFHKFETEKY